MEPKYQEKAGCRQLYSLHKNERHSLRHCKRCWNEIWLTSSHGLERSFPKGKNKKVLGLMENELGRNIMAELAALKPKTQMERPSTQKRRNEM